MAESAPLSAPLAPDGSAMVVFSDIACPWSYVLIHRLTETRRHQGLDDTVVIDHRALPLELIDGRPTDKERLDRLIPACRTLAPDAPWSLEPRPWTYPVTTLPALEAVQAARAQGPHRSEALDLALRRAVFGGWRCVSVHGVVMEVAAAVEGLDVDALWDEIRSGRPRADVWHHVDVAAASRIEVTPTVVLGDGSMTVNPGVAFHTDDEGDVVIDRDDPSVLEDLLLRSAGRIGAE